MVEHLMAFGVVSGVVAVGSFGAAVRQSVMISVREVYNDVVAEPVPEEFLVLVANLGQDEPVVGKVDVASIDGTGP